MPVPGDPIAYLDDHAGANGGRGYSFGSNPWVWVLSFRVPAPTPALES